MDSTGRLLTRTCALGARLVRICVPVPRAPGTAGGCLGTSVLQQLAGEIVLKPVSDEMVVRGNGGMGMRRQEMPWQREHVLEVLKEMPFEEVYMRYLVNGKPRPSVAAFGCRVMLPRCCANVFSS